VGGGVRATKPDSGSPSDSREAALEDTTLKFKSAGYKEGDANEAKGKVQALQINICTLACRSLILLRKLQKTKP
jgi:hypothetical protein